MEGFIGRRGYVEGEDVFAVGSLRKVYSQDLRRKPDSPGTLAPHASAGMNRDERFSVSARPRSSLFIPG